MDQHTIEIYWREHKYLVMYHSQAHYHAIRQALRDGADGAEIIRLVTEACTIEPTPGNRKNALQHMWGYFKKFATPEEKAQYMTLLANDPPALIPYLRTLAIKYEVRYLLDSKILQ